MCIFIQHSGREVHKKEPLFGFESQTDCFSFESFGKSFQISCDSAKAKLGIFVFGSGLENLQELWKDFTGYIGHN